MQESITAAIRMLGKMCQQCAKCQEGMEKGALAGEIGKKLLEYEDYFASSCEREYLSLQGEYVQFQRFIDESSEACFRCNGRDALMYAHAEALVAAIKSGTNQEQHKKRTGMLHSISKEKA